MGHDYRLHTFWALADRPGVDLEIEALRSLADDLRQPAQRWHVAVTQTVLKLMEGGFERAEELIAEALAVGGRAESWNALLSQRLAPVRAAPGAGAARGDRGHHQARHPGVPGPPEVPGGAGARICRARPGGGGPRGP